MKLLSALFAISFGAVLGAASSVDKPNLLFLFADDWGRYGGMYEDAGHPSYREVFRTPRLDRLAADGVVFENAFMPVPSCTPCRASIMTGQYFWRNGRGAFLGGGDWGAEAGLWERIPKFPNILEYLGYHVGYSGKVGVDWWPTHYPLMRQNQFYVNHGNTFMEFSQNVSGKPDIQAAKQAVYDEVLGNFRDFLDDASDPDQPWFYWFGPYNVHRSWVRGSGKSLWGIEPDDLKGKLPLDWPDVHEVREDFADYLGEIMAFDMYCRVLLEELDRRGLLDNTMIVATGDNGVPGFPRAKRNLYDKGIAAPLIVSWPGHVTPGRRVTDFVNLFDLAPTWIEAAGGTPPATMDARSLLNVLGVGNSGQIESERDHIITGRERHVRQYPMRAIRTKDYLYVINYQRENRPKLSDLPPGTFPQEISKQMDGGPTRQYLVDNYKVPEIWNLIKHAFDRRPESELFDLRKDPAQMHNVADDQSYAGIRASLHQQLMAVREDSGDLRVTHEAAAYDRPPYIEADSETRGKW